MNTKTFTTVPAQPGFFVLDPVYYENRVTNLSQEPVVAWVIESQVEQDGTVHGDATPVVYGGSLEGLPAILQPDGQVVLPFMGTFDSAGKYLLYLREELDGKPGEALEADTKIPGLTAAHEAIAAKKAATKAEVQGAQNVHVLKFNRAQEERDADDGCP